jgi:hypothetical protein
MHLSRSLFCCWLFCRLAEFVWNKSEAINNINKLPIFASFCEGKYRSTLDIDGWIEVISRMNIIMLWRRRRFCRNWRHRLVPAGNWSPTGGRRLLLLPLRPGLLIGIFSKKKSFSPAATTHQSISSSFLQDHPSSCENR